MKKKKILLSALILSAAITIFAVNRSNSSNLRESKILLPEEQIEPFLNLRGWKAQSVSVENITLPRKFTGKSLLLADMMRDKGLPLTEHGGETVKRYVFSLEEDLTAEFIIAQDDSLLSAALIQLRPDGFIKPL